MIETRNLKKKAAPFVENFGEATTACLVTMVQGNLLALGLTHWIIASQTGLVAGAAATLVLATTRTDSRLRIAIILGVVTAVVDFFMHPGMLNPEFLEAIVTGIGAGVLSYLFGTLLKVWRERRTNVTEETT